jgi:hypothetical protein
MEENNDMLRIGNIKYYDEGDGEWKTVEEMGLLDDSTPNWKPRVILLIIIFVVSLILVALQASG